MTNKLNTRLGLILGLMLASAVIGFVQALAESSVHGNLAGIRE
jgi:hypothetical protein